MRTYYLTDYKSSYEMLLQALKDLLDFNPNAKVYIHNFANFDYMFLIKVLYENFTVKPFFSLCTLLFQTYPLFTFHISFPFLFPFFFSIIKFIINSPFFFSIIKFIINSPFFKDNKVINLIYHSKDNDKTKIYIYDSYLIFPFFFKNISF